MPEKLVNVRFVNRSIGLMECLVCGEQWGALRKNLHPEEFDEGSLGCPFCRAKKWEEEKKVKK